MIASQDDVGSPPPERGRSASEARRVGVNLPSRFNRNGDKTARARRLRHQSTTVEMRLWQRLRNRQLGVDFRRQHPAGAYVLDFYCPSLALAIELDGGQHAEQRQAAGDAKRSEWLSQRGVTMLRFWNSDVFENITGVLETIAAKIAERQATCVTPTRRWRADLPLSGRGKPRERA